MMSLGTFWRLDRSCLEVALDKTLSISLIPCQTRCYLVLPSFTEFSSSNHQQFRPTTSLGSLRLLIFFLISCLDGSFFVCLFFFGVDEALASRRRSSAAIGRRSRRRRKSQPLIELIDQVPPQRDKPLCRGLTNFQYCERKKKPTHTTDKTKKKTCFFFLLHQLGRRLPVEKEEEEEEEKNSVKPGKPLFFFTERLTGSLF